MAGTQRNSGSTEQFNFRYQCLLIEIGTVVLRKLFGIRVGNDLAKYLAFNSSERNKLQSFINTHRITPAQEQLLPPMVPNPDLSSFDITLICCLLRNICGLCKPSGSVWTNPNPADLSLEADIARLRISRNELSHSGSLMLSETDFNCKWEELCKILNRLNNVCQIKDLTKLIEEAEHKPLDEKQKQKYDMTIKAWIEMDRLYDHGIEEVKSEVTKGFGEVRQHTGNIQTLMTSLVSEQRQFAKELGEVHQGVGSITEQITTLTIKQKGETELVAKELGEVRKGIGNIETQITTLAINQKHGNIELLEKPKQELACKERLTDMQKELIYIYERDCSTLSVSPLFDDEDEHLLKIYKNPTMHCVDYHKDSSNENNAPVLSYQDIFYKNGRQFKDIYVTGDAGTGKTSFCRRMCWLWCMSKRNKKNRGESEDKECIQADMDYISKFDYVFYVSLRDTSRTDVIAMIIDQLFAVEDETAQTEMYRCLKDILKQKESLIVLDAYDEWHPKTNEKKNCEKPSRIPSEKCIYLTTCRPYKIENVRLSRKDIDHHVQLTGIHGSSLESFIQDAVNHMNAANNENKDPSDFITEVENCGLDDHLSIPMIVLHLVALWFDRELSYMPFTLIYSNIIEMLLEKSEKRNIDFPTSTTSVLHLPDCFSQFFYLRKYGSLLQKLCLLSFRSLFKQDEHVSTLVFTKQQLMSEPYFLSPEETDFLCRIGVISKTKVAGRSLRQKQKLSFLHQTYIEFFAAFFVGSFDKDNLFEQVIKEFTSITDVVQYETFYLFLTGFSYPKLKYAFKNIPTFVSNDLDFFRKNHFWYAEFCFLDFEEEIISSRNNVMSLQKVVVDCFHEMCLYEIPNNHFKLEDFIFVDDDDSLKELLLLNASYVKSLSIMGHEELFGGMSIKRLALSLDCNVGSYMETLVPSLSLKNLNNLTSLSLILVKWTHEGLHNFVQFLSSNVVIENIKLSNVSCKTHSYEDGCVLALNLSNHTRLTSLCLHNLTILCNNVNKSCLKSLTFFVGGSDRDRKNSYIGTFNSIKNSKLEKLDITGFFMTSDGSLEKALVSTVKTLPFIKSIKFHIIDIPDDMLLELHCDVTQAYILLSSVTMSFACFQAFVRSLEGSKGITVNLNTCRVYITSAVGENNTKMTTQKSVDNQFMSEYLKSIPSIKISHESDRELIFDTTH